MDVALSAVSELSLPKDEISLAIWLKVFYERKRLILSVTVISALVAAGIAFLLPPTYKAEAVIIPPQQTHSSMSMMSAHAAHLGGLAGLGLTGMLWKNPADLYIGILESRTIADSLVEKF